MAIYFIAAGIGLYATAGFIMMMWVYSHEKAQYNSILSYDYSMARMASPLRPKLNWWLFFLGPLACVADLIYMAFIRPFRPLRK